MRTTIERFVLLPLFVILNAFFLQAQDSEDKLRELSLEELLNVPVVTATKQEQSSLDAPATVYVFTEQQIRNRGYNSIEDLLEDVPEVEIQRESNHETWNNVTMRGVSGNEKFILLVDGIRVSAPTGDHHLVGTNYPLANAKRVEVILGPASALYGVDAFSGIIQIITKTGAEIQKQKVAGSYGRFKTTDDSFVLGSKFHDVVGVSLTGQLYHSAGPFFPSFYPTEYAWYTDQYSKNGQVRVSPFAPPNVVLTVPIRPWETPTDSHFVHARLNAGDFEFGYLRNFESHSTSVSVRPEFTIYSADAKWQTTLDSVYAKYTLTSSDRKWNLQSTLSRGTQTIGTESKFLNTYSSYQDAFKYGYGKDLKIEEQFSWFFKPGNTLTAGFTFDDQDALPKSSDLPFAFDPHRAADSQGLYYLGTNIKDVHGNDLTIYQDFFYVQYQNVGSYLQYQGRLLPKLELTLGTRYDNNTRYGDSVNPRVGLVYTPVSKMKVKFLYGTSFLAPSPFKAYGHYGSLVPVADDRGDIVGLQSFFLRLPNPDLKPERLRAFEGDASYYLNEHVALYLSIYFNRIKDLIVEQDTANQYFKGIPVADVQTLVNKGIAHANGGSLRVDSLWKTGPVMLNFYGSYSYSDGDVQDDVLPFSARNTVKAGMDLTYRKLSISPRLVHRSKTYLPRKDASGNPISNKPFTLVNLFIRYSNLVRTPAVGNSIYLKINNLTDRRYYNVRPEGGDSELLATPQDPIRFETGFTLEF